MTTNPHTPPVEQPKPEKRSFRKSLQAAYEEGFNAGVGGGFLSGEEAWENSETAQIVARLNEGNKPNA